jgi:hypothetical protein
MLKLPDDIHHRDVQQWVGGGFVLIKGKVAAHYDNGDFFPDDSDEDERRPWFSVEGAEERQYDLGDIMCHWPRCGSINTGRGFALYVQREQRRQWRRTYNTRCVVSSTPLKRQVARRYGNRMVSTFSDVGYWQTVQALFFPEYVSPLVALESIYEKEAMTVAVSPQVILGGYGRRPLHVFYRGRHVANWDNGNIENLSGKGEFLGTLNKVLEEIL